MGNKQLFRGGGVLTALLASTLSAQAMVVTAWTPTTTPKYYYGTFNPVNYAARPENGEKITKLTLYIGGEATYVLTNVSGTSRPAVAGAIFDSTHFPLGAGGAYYQLETHLDVEYMNSAGVAQPPLTGQCSTTIPIKNKALIATIGTPPFNTLVGTTYLGDLIVTGNTATSGEKHRLDNNNISVSTKGPFVAGLPGVPASWSFDDVKTATSPNHIVIINTHGHATLPTMADGTTQFTFDSAPWKTQIMSSFGTDKAAPLNANAVPPVNLLFLACCKMGNFVGTKWSDVLYPSQNEFLTGQINPNQACIGFKCAINGFDVPGMMDTILQDMVDNSHTLSQAMAAFLISPANQLNMVSDTVDSNGETSGTRKMTDTDFDIAGDPIHGVYTGSDVPSSNGWWR